MVGGGPPLATVPTWSDEVPEFLISACRSQAKHLAAAHTHLICSQKGQLYASGQDTITDHAQGKRCHTGPWGHYHEQEDTETAVATSGLAGETWYEHLPC